MLTSLLTILDRSSEDGSLAPVDLHDGVPSLDSSVRLVSAAVPLISTYYHLATIRGRSLHQPQQLRGGLFQHVDPQGACHRPR